MSLRHSIPPPLLFLPSSSVLLRPFIISRANVSTSSPFRFSHLGVVFVLSIHHGRHSSSSFISFHQTRTLRRIFSSQLLFSHRRSSSPFIPSGVVTFLTPPHLPFSVKSHSFRPFIINLFMLLQVLTFAISTPLSPFVYCLFFFFSSKGPQSISSKPHTDTYTHPEFSINKTAPSIVHSAVRNMK